MVLLRLWLCWLDAETCTCRSNIGSRTITSYKLRVRKKDFWRQSQQFKISSLETLQNPEIRARILNKRAFTYWIENKQKYTKYTEYYQHKHSKCFQNGFWFESNGLNKNLGSVLKLKICVKKFSYTIFIAH